MAAVKSKEKSSTGSAYVSFSYCLACQFDSGHPKKRPYQHRLRIKSLDPKQVVSLIDFPGNIKDMIFHAISYDFGADQINNLLIISF